MIVKSELERARLIREARAIYESIFPRAAPVDKIADGENTPAGGKGGTTGE